jgi:hypothetical protein
MVVVVSEGWMGEAVVRVRLLRRDRRIVEVFIVAVVWCVCYVVLS